MSQIQFTLCFLADTYFTHVHTKKDTWVNRCPFNNMGIWLLLGVMVLHGEYIHFYLIIVYRVNKTMF